MTAIDLETLRGDVPRGTSPVEEDDVLSLTESDLKQCQTPEQLLRSEPFARFLAILNRSKSRINDEHCAVTPESVREYASDAAKAHAFIQEMSVQGKITVTSRLQNLADKTFSAVQQSRNVMNQNFSEEKK